MDLPAYIVVVGSFLVIGAVLFQFNGYVRRKGRTVPPLALALLFAAPTIALMSIVPDGKDGVVVNPGAASLLWGLLSFWPYLLCLCVLFPVELERAAERSEQRWAPTLMHALTVVTLGNIPFASILAEALGQI